MHTLLLAAVIHVTLNGAPAPDAELCGFRAAGTETPFRQLLASNEIVCGQLSPGLWNVFARRADKLVSARTVLVDTRKPVPELELRLEPAANVIAPGAFVYVTETMSAFPAGTDGVALVPADRDILPLRARDGSVVAVGVPLRLAAGETRAAVFEAK